MPRTYECPFWKWEKGLSFYCEGGRVHLPDITAKWDYIRAYCGHHPGWQTCTLARALEGYYDRKL